jgi:hypothetical protein
MVWYGMEGYINILYIVIEMLLEHQLNFCIIVRNGCVHFPVEQTGIPDHLSFT